jgi:hypothetical protein
MAKQNKKIWRGWTPCKKCNGRKTYGGIKILFGLFRLKKWEHPCKKCVISTLKAMSGRSQQVNMYAGVKTELDKEKCEEVINENKEQNNDK